MPATHARRGSGLPYHRSKYKSKSKPRSKKWWYWVILLVLVFLGFRHWTRQPLDEFTELTLARHYHPSPAIGTTIPNIVHFVYGLKGPNPTLDLIHYLAIKAAHDRLEPDTIMFHYHYLPTGNMFELARPYLTLHHVDLVPMVFDRPITHFAHQADIIRLDMLQQYGGIYLDLDVIVMGSMGHLLQHEFVMGQEGIDGSVGLCNAVILAKPNARFLQRWQQTYRTFDQADWNYHSVVLPGKLYPSFASEITVLNHTAFFWPLWDSNGLRTLFLEKSYDFGTNYATHIWESAANPHLMHNLSMDVIQNVDTSLYCQLRLLLPDPRPCTRMDHSPRPDRLVGHWPLSSGLDMNPTPATDTSGNEMHGVIRNGEFTAQGLYTNGQDSYVFLSMPNQMTIDGMTVQWQMQYDALDGVAMMVQTDRLKIMVKAHAVEVWRLEGWQWQLDESTPLRLDGDHTYTLVLGSTSLLTPSVVLYQDNNVVASVHPILEPVVVRGLWFGSAEPDKYQDPWDTRASLAAWYKQIHVWEQPLTIDPPLTIHRMK